MYEFASGVINVWEKKVLSRNDQERMLTAPDKASSFMVLFDTDLGELASNTDDIESIFENDLCLLKEKLMKVSDDQNQLASYLFISFDVWNLKMALKEHLLDDKLLAVEPFVCSLVSYDKLKTRALEVWQKGVLPGDDDLKSVDIGNVYLEKIISLSRQLLGQSLDVDSVQIETAVDRAYFKIKQEAAKKISPFLEELARLEIDVANLKGLVGHGGSFIEGGNLNIQEAQELLESREGEISEENLAKFLEVLNLSFLIENFIKNKSDEIILEQGLQAFLSRRVFEKSRATASGLEKVLAFFYRKMNSHFNIRLILFAKDNNLPPADIENLLLPV